MKKVKDWIADYCRAAAYDYKKIVTWLVVAELGVVFLLFNQGSSIGGSIWTFCFLFFTIPTALIAWGVIKNKGLKTKIIDLSEFEFGHNKAEDNFHISYDRARILDDMLLAEIRKDKLSGTRGVGPYDAAKRLCIEHDLPSDEYLMLLIKASFIIASNQHRMPEPGGLSDRLQAIKDKLIKAKKSDDESDQENKGGKYGFL